MKKLQKIISGGQTGVDQAALKAGLENNFQIGGWCPPGRVCEDGVIPREYPLVETPEDRCPNAPDVKHSQRTENNVRDSDATLILNPDKIKYDPGTRWTHRCAKQYNKPCFIIDPYAPDAEKKILEWLQGKPISILNIAGPSEKTAQGINVQTYNLLSGIFRITTHHCCH